jgi:hypothetical protein
VRRQDEHNLNCDPQQRPLVRPGLHTSGERLHHPRAE